MQVNRKLSLLKRQKYLLVKLLHLLVSVSPCHPTPTHFCVRFIHWASQNSLDFFHGRIFDHTWVVSLVNPPASEKKQLQDIALVKLCDVLDRLFFIITQAVELGTPVMPIVDNFLEIVCTVGDCFASWLASLRCLVFYIYVAHDWRCIIVFAN